MRTTCGIGGTCTCLPLLLFFLYCIASADGSKLCKKSNFARKALKDCAKDKIAGNRQLYWGSSAIEYGEKSCSEFWPSLKNCVKKAMVQEKCSNPQHVMSVLKRHTYMCDGNRVKQSVKTALENFDNAGLHDCKRYLRLRCFPPNIDSIPGQNYNTTTPEEEVEHFQRYWIKPKLKCGYERIKRKLTEKSLDKCVKRMKDVWIFLSVAINNMAIFGFYSEPGNWPEVAKN